MHTFTIPRPVGFRLAATSLFLANFVPGSGMAAAAVGADRVTLAFLLDGSFEPVVAELCEKGDSLVVTFAGTEDSSAVSRQVSRILGLEGNAAAWAALGARDATVGRLQRAFPGFFTVAKPSPYDAAVWSIIAPRMGMKQAASIKLAMARTLGDSVSLEGRVHHVFPAPARLAALDAFPGLSDEKVSRLRGVAVTALDGRLDADRLRGAGERDALRELQTLRGIGPWAASHIYCRGAAPPDALPTAEPRVLHGFADVAGLPDVDEAAFRRAADAWRPFRMWVCVLLSRHLAATGGWRAPELGRERARAGRSVVRSLRA